MTRKRWLLWSVAAALVLSACGKARQAPLEPPASASDQASQSTSSKDNEIASPTDLKLLSPLPPPSPDSAAPSSDPRNFEGIWYIAVNNAPLIRTGGAALPPYTAARLEREKYKREMNDKGMPIAGLSGRCRPPPRAALHIGADQFPAEIVQTPQQVIILNEEMRARWVIFLTDRHPQDLKPTYFGDSIGHWEGDTLVVETTGFNGEEDTLSTRARVVSRLRKLEGGKVIELQQTTEDPVTYTRAVESTRTSNWNPDLQMLEFQCEENLAATRTGLVHEADGQDAVVRDREAEAK